MDLKGYLADVGETQVQFARRARVSQSLVSRLLRNQNMPRADTAVRILRAFALKPPSRGAAPTMQDLIRQRKGDDD